MIFDIITIFPKCFASYFSESIIKRAQKKRIIKINIHNLRDFVKDKHRTVDDRPYGGGPGMILKIEPIYKAVEQIKRKAKRKKERVKIILLSPRGKTLNQKIVNRLTKYDRLILICGRYEGVDERVAKYIADEVISLGDYIISGGELGAMIIVEAVSRLIPGVLGKKDSLKEESFSQPGYLEYPQYTRPEEFHGWKVPKVLLSGDHQKIKEWKEKHSKVKRT